MATAIGQQGYDVWPSDIMGGSLGCTTAVMHDFLTSSSGRGHVRFSIITNPPYTLAEKFIRKALELTQKPKGMIAMLLRNEYDCAASRRDLFEHQAFTAKLVLTKRPRWIDSGHTASPRHNFAWYVWDWQHSGPARIEWLP